VLALATHGYSALRVDQELRLGSTRPAPAVGLSPSPERFLVDEECHRVVDILGVCVVKLLWWINPGEQDVAASITFSAREARFEHFCVGLG
jgi:hypothetical protein